MSGSRIVLIGATGYTGRLVAHELAGGPASFVLAGRDPGRLHRLAGELGARPETRRVDVTDAHSLSGLLARGDVVINCAGPFTRLGEPVVRACIRAGASYLDTTGEQPWMHAMYQRHDGAARAAGVAVVNAMAFEYALGDCAAALAVDGLARPVRTVDVVYAWGAARGSRGTRRTVLRMLAERPWVLEDGAWRRRPHGAGHRSFTFGSGRTLRAVQFGSGEVVTIPRWLDVRDVRGWLVMGRGRARAVRWLAPALPVVIPWLRPLLEPLLTRAPDPDAETRQGSRFTVRVEARGDDGRRREVEVRGRDPYAVTAAIAVRGALAVLRPDCPAGVLAPAMLVQPAAFLNDLADRGIELAIGPPPSGPDRNGPPGSG